MCASRTARRVVAHDPGEPLARPRAHAARRRARRARDGTRRRRAPHLRARARLRPLPGSARAGSPAASACASTCCASRCSAPTCCCSTSRRTTSTRTRPRSSRVELEAFTGCVVAATHDRYFLDTFATRIVELTAVVRGARASTSAKASRRGHERRALEARYRARSLWLDGLAEPLAPRPALAGDRDCDVAIVGAGFTGLWAAYFLALAAARPAHRRGRARDRRLRPVRPQRRLGVGGLAGSARRLRSALRGDDAVRRGERAMADAVSEIGRVVGDEAIDCGWRAPAARSWSRRAPRRSTRLHEGVERRRAFGMRRGRSATARAVRARPARARAGCAGRVVHAPLRARRSGPPGARPGRCLRAPRRRHLRAHGGRRRSSRAACAAPAARCARRPVLRATEAFTVQQPGRAAALHAALLADGRDRAARRPPSGRSSAGTAARRSPTCATCSSTRSALPTTASPSAAAVRRTVWGRRSTRPTSATTACARD